MLDIFTDLLFGGLNVVSPFLIYGPQLKLMNQTRSIGSFPLSTCTIIICSSFLRLLSSPGVDFLFSLAIQAAILIVLHIIISRTYFSIRSEEKVKDLKSKADVSSINQVSTEERDYFRTLFVSFLIAGGILYIFNFSSNACLFFLYASSVVEALLPMPQFWKNHTSRSVEGVSLSMIALWFAGDAFKLLMFSLKGQPFAFVLCAIIQLAFDCLILYQFVNYSPKASPSAKKSE